MNEKVGPTIGLIIGAIIFVLGMMAITSPEAASADSANRSIVIVGCIIGFSMVVLNIMNLVEKKPAQAASVQAKTSISKISSKNSSESEETGTRIRCRFCGKKYSTEYNGCPYCKKK